MTHLTSRPRRRAARWVCAALALAFAPGAVAAAEAPRPRTRADSLAYWQGRNTSGDPIRPYALRAVARLRAALGDTLEADSAWAELAALPTPYRWEADEARIQGALARRDTALARARLEVACGRTTSPYEQAGCLSLRMKLALAARDSFVAERDAQLLLERHHETRAALEALAALEPLHAARGEALADHEQRHAARVEWELGQRAAAERRLERQFASATGHEQVLAGLELAEALAASGRRTEARAWLERAAGVAVLPDADARARVALVSARLRQAAELGGVTAGRWGIGFEPRAVDVPFPRAQQLRERARELEALRRWREARLTLDTLALEVAPIEAGEARLRAALLALAEGEPHEARARLEHPVGEAAEFWHAVLLRREDRARADSLLGAIARRPGHTFHRIAARESLGVPPAPIPEPPPSRVANGSLPPSLALADALERVGLDVEAFRMLVRWSRGEAGDPPPGSDTHALVAAAELSARLGRRPFAISIAARAARVAAADDTTGVVHALRAMYPLDALPRLIPPAATQVHGVDRALVSAVIWQESKFDPAARSRTGATGLMQLTRPTAREVARQLGRRRPRTADLLDAATSLRLGTRYLANLLRRFPGDTVLAVAAYNAGPGAVSRFPRVGAHGGAALEAELIAYPEAQDYVRRVMTARAAYRDLLRGRREPARR